LKALQPIDFRSVLFVSAIRGDPEMNFKHVFVALGVSLLVGCTPPIAYTTSYLFPVQGPLSIDKPIPVIPVKFTNDFRNSVGLIMSGDISFSLPSGESFSGRWSREAYINSDPIALAQQRETDIKAAWDTVYGQGYYIANVLGSLIHARAILKGSKGNSIQIEFNSAQPWPTRGVARDDQGNIYKLVVP
jgi:hypothetical protein